jgi:spermidine/putrescine transport system permease protein
VTRDGPTRRVDWLIAFGGAYLVFLYAPILLIPLFSFSDSIYIAFPIEALTLKWYQAMWEQDALVKAFANSIKVGVVVALVSTVLGTLAAKAVTRYELRGRALVVAFLMLPFGIPPIVLGISLLVEANLAGVPLSLFTIGAGHVLICVPFSMLVMISRMEGFDKSLEEASVDLGENGWMTFWLITFPLALPGLVASFLLTFTLSFDEFIIAFFLSGKEATLPLFIWSQLRFPTKLPNVLALGSSILMVSTLVVVAAEWLRRRDVAIDREDHPEPASAARAITAGGRLGTG